MPRGEKEAILRAIRKSLAAARQSGTSFVQEIEPASVFSPYRTGGDRESLVHKFLEQVNALGAEGFRVSTRDAGRARIREVILRHEARRVAMSAAPVVVSLEVESLLTELGVEIITLPADGTACARDDYLRRLMTAHLAITGADYGLADSGTLVLSTKPTEGRLMSLLPPVQVTLLTVTQIVPSLADLLSPPAPGVSDRSLIFITGPSRTADIEQTLTVGVHGPNELHVLLLE